MKLFLKRIVAGLALLISTNFAQAHFLWITIDSSEQPRLVNVFFEHALQIEDGKYIPHFISRGKTWIADTTGVRELRVADTGKEKMRWLSAEIESSAPLRIDSYGLFGVYRYGTEDVLLHYYAKHLDIRTAGHLKQLGASNNLDLDIVPTQSEDGKITVQVLWKGKPAKGRKITVRGPTRLDLKTDENGLVHFDAKKKGLHSFLTSVEEMTPGTDPLDKKDFVKIRHQSTLTMVLPAGEKQEDGSGTGQ